MKRSYYFYIISLVGVLVLVYLMEYGYINFVTWILSMIVLGILSIKISHINPIKDSKTPTFMKIILLLIFVGPIISGADDYFIHCLTTFPIVVGMSFYYNEVRIDE